MGRLFVVVGAICAAWCVNAHAQGVDDLFAGKLVDPKVGQWAWYEITDASGGNKHAVRQAVVGEEKVKRKTGYWVEFELVPPLGFKTVYQMLVTGPANNPRNVHRIRIQRGDEAVEEVPVGEVFQERDPAAERPRTAAGSDTIEVAGQPLTAERYTVESDSGTVEIWINAAVPPTGIVRVKSAEGEMILRGYGQGGDAGKSALREKPEASAPKLTLKRVEKDTEGKARKDKKP